tara:strand:+ start:441 stop:842 length:402 start_codon:yes stop_codon:yes gene_type:complete
MIYNKNEREFINTINNSYYLKDVVKKMGYSLNNKTIKKIKMKMDELNININDFSSSKDIPLESHNIKKNNKEMKRKLLEKDLIENKCQSCKIGDMWNGRLLSLKLDYNNGNPNDKNLDNIRLLCPNCYNQLSI